MCAQLLSRLQLCVTPWTAACQAPQSMGFPRQEYWSELPSSPSGSLSDPGINPASLASPALAGGFFTTGKPYPAHIHPKTSHDSSAGGE